jgi:3-deoxy-D-manno-octulosonate 8-phosphate phosphatase (KDO 8-P phosphatase)
MFENVTQEVLDAAKRVKVLLLDVDGVMTDGRIILDNNGNEYKAFNVRDGHGIKMIQREDIQVAIITGRSSAVVERRATELGINGAYIRQGSKKKTEAYAEIIEDLKKDGVEFTDEEVAYIGDDIVDLPVMVKVGFPVAVADAWEELSRHAKYVTKAMAGKGAVREVTDLILKAKGRLDDIIKTYTQA